MYEVIHEFHHVLYLQRWLCSWCGIHINMLLGYHTYHLYAQNYVIPFHEKVFCDITGNTVKQQ